METFVENKIQPLSLRFSSGEVVETRAFRNVLVDYDAQGKVLGIEILPFDAEVLGEV